MVKEIPLKFRVIIIGIAFIVTAIISFFLGLGKYSLIAALVIAGFVFLELDPSYQERRRRRRERQKREEEIRRRAELEEEGKLRAQEGDRQRREEEKMYTNDPFGRSIFDDSFWGVRKKKK